MFLGSETGEYFEIEVMDYEYPVGWGAGTKFETDWLIADLNICVGDGEETSIEGSFFRYTELEDIFEALGRISMGEQVEYYAPLMSPNLSFSAELKEGDIFATLRYIDEEDDLKVSEQMLPERFMEFQKSIEDILKTFYRPKL